MSAATPGTVRMSAAAADGAVVTATAYYDPDTLALRDPFLTATGSGRATVTVTDAVGAVHTFSVVPGAVLAAADLAALGLTGWDQIHGVALAAA